MSTENEPTTPTPPSNADEWVASLDEATKGFLDGHVTGLKTSLSAERDARKQLEKELKELRATAEKGSEMESKLGQLEAGLAQRERQVDFYEAANASGVTNPRLAWLAAMGDDLFTRDGRPDMKALKERHPELFGTVTPPPTNAGSGTGQEPKGAPNVDDFIRRAAGKI